MWRSLRALTTTQAIEFWYLLIFVIVFLLSLARITLQRRAVRRFTRFLLFLGYSASDAGEVKIQAFCRTVSAFAMEYRTAKEKLIQQRQKAASLQARKGSRGFITVDVTIPALFGLLHAQLNCMRLDLRWSHWHETTRELLFNPPPSLRLFGPICQVSVKQWVKAIL